MIAVMPEVELLTDDLSHAEGRPAGIWKTVDLRTLDQESCEDVPLFLREGSRSAGGDGRLERVWATVTEAIVPVADGTHRDTQELSEFLGAVHFSLKELEITKSSFFKLSSGQVRWEPAVSHLIILLSFTSARSVIGVPTESKRSLDMANDLVHNSRERLYRIYRNTIAGHAFFRLIQPRNELLFLWFSAPIRWISCYTLVKSSIQGV